MDISTTIIGTTLDLPKESLLVKSGHRVLITGCYGMDGSILTKKCLDRGWEVIGLKRRSSTDNPWRLNALKVNGHKNLKIVEGDITDYTSVFDILSTYKPTIIFNTAAQSHVGTSFQQPYLTWRVTAEGAINIFNAAKVVVPNVRIIQNSTSEMFGSNINGQGFQDENTGFSPNSPYAVAKLAAHEYARMMREAYNMFISSTITFNHSCYLRGDNFVERKITKWVGEFIKWLGDYDPDDLTYYDDHVEKPTGQTFSKLRLGDLSTYRDIGYAFEYCDQMIEIALLDKPDDYVIATGVTHKIEDVLKLAFSIAGLDHKKLVKIDPSLMRAREVENLRGDSSKLRARTGFSPKYSIKDIISEMVLFDVEQ